jgi:Sigma-70 factor, region 1.2
MNESESGLNRYMRDIWRFPLLTLQQELELAEKIKKGDGEEKPVPQAWRHREDS